MSPRALHALDATPGSASRWVEAIGAALDGGPALLPLPAGPAPVRDGLVAAFRPGDPAAPLEHDDAVLVVPTSGSTGEPKGAVLTATAVTASAGTTFARLSGPGCWVLAVPLTHVAGLMVVVRASVGGTRPVEVDTSGGFDPRRFAEATAAASSRAGALPLYVSLVPTQLGRLIDAGVDLRPYAAVLLGGAAAPRALLDRARDAGAAVVTTYGMSETCGGCVYDGLPLDGVTVDVDVDGRVVLGGPTVFAGYRLRPDLTSASLDESGRFRTSDLGRVRDGRLHVIGRADDVVVTGGENVAPARVEAVLRELDGVRDCVAVGVPDADWGERLVAVVVPGEGRAAPTLQSLRAAAASELPAAWLPRAVVLTGDVPLLATGKVDRAAVRDLAVRTLAADGSSP